MSTHYFNSNPLDKKPIQRWTEFLSPVSNQISSDMKKTTSFCFALVFQEISKRPLQLLQTQHNSTNFRCREDTNALRSKQNRDPQRPAVFKRKLHWQRRWWRRRRRESSYTKFSAVAKRNRYHRTKQTALCATQKWRKCMHGGAKCVGYNGIGHPATSASPPASQPPCKSKNQMRLYY